MTALNVALTKAAKQVDDLQSKLLAAEKRIEELESDLKQMDADLKISADFSQNVGELCGLTSGAPIHQEVPQQIRKLQQRADSAEAKCAMYRQWMRHISEVASGEV